MNEYGIMKGHSNIEKPRPRLETRKSVKISDEADPSGMGSSIPGDFQIGYKVSKAEEGELPDFKRPKLTENREHLEARPPDQCQRQAVRPCDGRDCMVPLRQDEMCQRFRKGLMASVGQSPVMASQFNPLDEPSPLGLSLRKSPSLLDLIQRKLMQCEDEGTKIADLENPGSKTNRSGRAVSLLGTEKDKLKAANFPALTLRIGTWEYTSRYDGDLVAKCYYAKRKIVWEILDRSLKSKMEIQWSDISGLKATFSEDQPATLDLELSRPPLFFREINPQPRKHTLWQSTSDFTDEQATMCRHHSVQFPEGVLNRHFEKLLQCDPRLKVLNEQTHAIKDSMFFDNRNMRIDGQHILHYQSVLPEHATIHPSIIEGFSDEPFKNRAPASDLFYRHRTMEGLKEPAAHVSSDVTYITPGAEVLQPPRGVEMQFSDVASPSSVIDARGSDESSSSSETEEMPPKEEVPGRAYDERLHSSLSSVSSTSFPTFIAGSSKQMGEWESIYHPEIPLKWEMGTASSSPSIGLSEKQVLNEISLHLFGETVSSTDRHAYTSGQARVNSLSPICIKEGFEELTNIHSALQSGAPFTVSACRDLLQPNSKHLGSCQGLKGDEDMKVQFKSGENYWNSSLENRSSPLETGLSFASHGSCADLLYMPRIASLPQFFEPTL